MRDMPKLTDIRTWALTNFGRAIDIAPTKRQAIEIAEELSGLPWSECREWFEVRKITLVDGWEK